jgi:hypothetical protein
MKSRAITLAIAIILSSHSHAESLCRNDEIDYFSCRLKNSAKLLSICGNVTNGEIVEGSWLQYRFGKQGAIELAYPKETQDSIQKFEGNYFNKYGVIDLRFVNTSVKYSVELDQPYDGEDAQRRSTYSAGVSAELSNGKRIQHFCVGTDFRKYFERFSALNDWLRGHNGDTDIFYTQGNR